MEITFQQHPDVIIGGNCFRNVKTIIKCGDTSLLEVGKFEVAGYSIRFPVYNSDGVKIAVVSGKQIYLTEEGKKARLTPRFEPNLTVCELEGKPILELRRDGAAAVRGWAELYAADGILVRAIDPGVSALLRGGNALRIGGMQVRNCLFEDFAIGIHVRQDGIALGYGGGKMSPLNLGMPAIIGQK